MTKNLIFTSLFILILEACTNGISRLLVEADRVIKENPDSAMMIIESINTKDLSKGSEEALYALLLTEARYKTGIEETDDSVISIATDHYHLQDKKPLRARAYYQKGMVNINAKKYSDALLSLMIAEETAVANKDTLLFALIHRSMGDIFGKIENHKTAISYYQKSYDEFMALNDSVYTLWALYDLARANYNATDYNESIELSESLLERAENKRDDYLITSTLRLLGDACETIDDNSAAINYLTCLKNEYSSYMMPTNWNSLGLAYLKAGNINKAQECEDTLKKISADQWWLSYRIADTVHDYSKALALLEVEYYDNHEIALDWISRRSEKGLLDQYGFLKQNAANEKKENRIRLILIGIICCLILAIAIILLKRFRNKNVKLSVDNKSLLKRKNELQRREKELLFELEQHQITILELKEKIKSQEREIFGLRAKSKCLDQDIEELQNEINQSNEYNEKLRSQLDELRSEQILRENNRRGEIGA